MALAKRRDAATDLLEGDAVIGPYKPDGSAPLALQETVGVRDFVRRSDGPACEDDHVLAHAGRRKELSLGVEEKVHKIRQRRGRCFRQCVGWIWIPGLRERPLGLGPAPSASGATSQGSRSALRRRKKPGQEELRLRQRVCRRQRQRHRRKSRAPREFPAMRACKPTTNIAQFRSPVLWMRLEPGHPLGRRF